MALENSKKTKFIERKDESAVVDEIIDFWRLLKDEKIETVEFDSITRINNKRR